MACRPGISQGPDVMHTRSAVDGFLLRCAGVLGARQTRAPQHHPNDVAFRGAVEWCSRCRSRELTRDQAISRFSTVPVRPSGCQGVSVSPKRSWAVPSHISRRATAFSERYGSPTTSIACTARLADANPPDRAAHTRSWDPLCNLLRGCRRVLRLLLANDVAVRWGKSFSR